MRNQRLFNSMMQRRQQAAQARHLESMGGPVHVHVHDRFGNPIEVGDVVLMEPQIMPVWRVVDVSPALDPSAPKGAARLVLAAEVPVHFQSPAQLANVTIINVPLPQEIAHAAETNSTTPAGDGAGSSSDPNGREPDAGGDDAGRGAAPGGEGAGDPSTH